MPNEFLGFPLGKNFTILSGNKILDKRTGIVFEIENLSGPIIKELSSESSEVEIKKEVEVITGIDTVRIDLTLATSHGRIAPKEGFMIEVYESGSDGVLTQMPRKNVIDEINETVIQEGFENYIILKVDE